MLPHKDDIEEDLLFYITKQDFDDIFKETESSVRSPLEKDAATYFAGFIFRYINKNHFSATNVALNDCPICNSLIRDPDPILHSIVLRKDYGVDNDDLKLTYCTEIFINFLMKLEKIHLYFFNLSLHNLNYLKSIVAIVIENFETDIFCTPQFTEKVVKKVFLCRLLKDIKKKNSDIYKLDYKTKIMKLKHI